MNDRDIFSAVVNAAESARSVALVTVIRARGSTPRHAGSKMVIDPENDRLIGTIGGGCGEGDVIEAAGEVVRTGRPRLVRVELMDSVDSFSPAVCGGIMDVFIEPVVAEGSADRADQAGQAGRTDRAGRADQAVQAGRADLVGWPAS